MRIPSWLWLTPTLLVSACGGSAVEQGSDPAQLVQDACNSIVGLQCSSVTQQQCNQDMNQARTDAAADGCGSAFDAVAACYAKNITDCSEAPRNVCRMQLQNLDNCEAKGGSAMCSGGRGSPPPGAPGYYDQCEVTCASWSAQCETKTSPILECSCTSGPRSGATFTAMSCNDLVTTLGAQHCQG